MFENGFATRTESAKKCIFPVIHQLDALGDAAYGGRFYDGDMNVLHVNVLPTARTNLSAALRTDFLTGEALTDFDKHIQFHVVKYSQAQMNTLQETVRKELMGHAGCCWQWDAVVPWARNVLGLTMSNVLGLTMSELFKLPNSVIPPSLLRRWSDLPDWP